jgi:hypothetical protein
VHVVAHGATSASAQKGLKMTGGKLNGMIKCFSKRSNPFDERAKALAAGFVGEMRAVAMKLHTKEQAPKEGGIEAPKPVKAVCGVHEQLHTANGVSESAGLGAKQHTVQKQQQQTCAHVNYWQHTVCLLTHVYIGKHICLTLVACLSSVCSGLLHCRATCSSLQSRRWCTTRLRASCRRHLTQSVSVLQTASSRTGMTSWEQLAEAVQHCCSGGLLADA